VNEDVIRFVMEVDGAEANIIDIGESRLFKTDVVDDVGNDVVYSSSLIVKTVREVEI